MKNLENMFTSLIEIKNLQDKIFELSIEMQILGKKILNSELNERYPNQGISEMY